MDIGMLWYDDDRRRPLDDKIARAVEYYKAKYGATPTVCFVNPGTLNGGPDVAAGVQVRSARSVLPNHVWVGVGDPAARVALQEKGTKGTKGSAKNRAVRVKTRAEAAVPSVP